MHKRNLFLTALVWAGIVTGLFLVFPGIYHGALGVFYLPTLALAVTIAHYFGGNGHSPSEAVGWSSFGVYTIFYWVVFLIIYVVLLEFWLLRRAIQHLNEATDHIASEQGNPKLALEKIGQAIAEVEKRRRKHFLLKANAAIKLDEAPHLLAARAMTDAKQAKLVKKVVRKLHKRLAAVSSSEQATAKLMTLNESAKKFLG